MEFQEVLRVNVGQQQVDRPIDPPGMVRNHWRLFIFISRESKWGTLQSAGNPRCAVPAEIHSICNDRPRPGPAAGLQVSPTSYTSQSVDILMNRPHLKLKLVWDWNFSKLVYILQICGIDHCISVLRITGRISVKIRTNTGTWQPCHFLGPIDLRQRAVAVGTCMGVKDPNIKIYTFMPARSPETTSLDIPPGVFSAVYIRGESFSPSTGFSAGVAAWEFAAQ